MINSSLVEAGVLFLQGRGKNVSVAPDKAFQYRTARDCLIRLGRAVGFEKQLEWYDFRRGSGKKLHKALTPEEANQSMGHTLGDTTTYLRFYTTDYIEVDFQEIVFGSEPQRDLIHLMGRLLRNGDAPTHLTDEQKTEVNQDPGLLKIRQKRDRVRAKIRKQGWTDKSAKDHELGRRLLEWHGRYHRQVESLKKKLYNQRLSQAIQEFHASAHGEEICRQLKGIQPSEYLAPPTIEYQLPERARIAKLFAEVANVSNRNELHQLRVSLVRELALLCKRRESPRRRQAESDGKKAPTSSAGYPELDPSPMPAYSPKSATSHKPAPTSKPIAPHEPACAKAKRVSSRSGPLTSTMSTVTKETVTRTSTRLVCPLCSCVDDVDSLIEHIRNRHVKRKAIPFHCPYERCSGIVAGAVYFADHCKRQHPRN